MKRFTRITAVLLSLILVAGCFGFAFADGGARFTDNGIIYSFNDEYGMAAVVGSTEDICGDVTVPSTVTYLSKTYKVSRIEARAFDGRDKITVLRVQEGVANIGANAFRGCTGMTELHLPQTLTYMYSSALEGCSDATVYCYKRGSNLNSVKMVSTAEFVFLDGEFNIGDFFAGLWQMVLDFFNKVGEFFKNGLAFI